MVAADHEGNDPSRGEVGHPDTDVVERPVDVAARARGVAVVDRLDVLEDVEPGTDMMERSDLVCVGAEGAGSEAGAGSVGGAEVERRSDQRCVRLPPVELTRGGEERTLRERHHPAELESLLQLVSIRVGQRPLRLVLAAVIGGWAHGTESATCRTAGGTEFMVAPLPLPQE
jgi:hypothetical protein